MIETNKTDASEHLELRVKDNSEDDAPFDAENDLYREAERSLLRKLDLTLVPMVWILYLFGYLDRNNLAQARLNGIDKDLLLKGDDFNTAVSLLNVGYLVMQIPSNMILPRIRPSLYIPFWICVWSCISASTAATHSYGTLVAVRITLGVAEAPFFPGVYYLLSTWYTKRELGVRMTIFYSGLVVATAFSGLISAGVFANLSGAYNIAGWRWLYIITGGVNFALGLLAFALLPDYPESSTGSQRWLLTEQERRIAIYRVSKDSIAQESNHSIWYGLRSAVFDYRSWMFISMLVANHAAYGFIYFFPTIVKSLKLGSNTITLVLEAPPYLIAAIVSVLVARSSDRLGERTYHIAIPMCVAAFGFIISAATLNGPARYVASFLYVGGCFSSIGLVYSWAADTLNQTPEKKAAATSLVNVIAQIGTIVAPYFFIPNEEPRYLVAMILLLVSSLLNAVMSIVMKQDLKRANKRLEDSATPGEQVRYFSL